MIPPAPLLPGIDNYYQTNAICRASVTMAQCVATFGDDASMKTGTHG